MAKKNKNSTPEELEKKKQQLKKKSDKKYAAADKKESKGNFDKADKLKEQARESAKLSEKVGNKPANSEIKKILSPEEKADNKQQDKSQKLKSKSWDKRIKAAEWEAFPGIANKFNEKADKIEEKRTKSDEKFEAKKEEGGKDIVGDVKDKTKELVGKGKDKVKGSKVGGYNSLSRAERDKLEMDATNEAPNMGVSEDGKDAKSAIELGKEKFKNLKKEGGLKDYFTKEQQPTDTPQNNEDPEMEEEKKTTNSPDQPMASGKGVQGADGNTYDIGPDGEPIIKREEGVDYNEPVNTERAAGGQIKEAMHNQSMNITNATPEERAAEGLVGDPDKYKKAQAVNQAQLDERDALETHTAELGKVVNPDPAGDNDPEKRMTTDAIEAISDEDVNKLAEGDMQAQDIINKRREHIKKGVNYAQPAIEKMGLQQYYPEVNTPLQVGTYSGSIVGSNPIFGSGAGYFPLGIVDARKRAFERVKKEKIKKKQELTNLAMTMAKAADPYQNQVNDMAFDLVREMEEQVNGDWSLVESDPELREKFFKGIATAKWIGEKSLAVEASMDKVMEDLNDDKKHIPAYIHKNIHDWNTGKYDIESLMKDPTYFADLQRDMRSWDNWSTDIAAMAKDMRSGGAGMDKQLWNMKEGVATKDVQEAYSKLDRANYDEMYTFYATYFDQSRMDGLLNGLMEQNDYYLGKTDSEIAEKTQEMKKYFLSMFPEQVNFNKSVANHGEAKARAIHALNKQKNAQENATVWTEKHNMLQDASQDILSFAKSGDVEKANSEFAMATGSVYNEKTGKFDIELTGEKTKTYSPQQVTYAGPNGEAFTYSDMQEMAADESHPYYESAKWTVAQGQLDVAINKAHPSMATFKNGSLVTYNNLGEAANSSDQLRMAIELEGTIKAPAAQKIQYQTADKKKYNTPMEAFEVLSQSNQTTMKTVADAVSSGQILEVEPTESSQIPGNYAFTVTQKVDGSDPTVRGALDQEHGASVNLNKAYQQGGKTLPKATMTGLGTNDALENPDPDYDPDEL